jgi:plastocyanin
VKPHHPPRVTVKSLLAGATAVGVAAALAVPAFAATKTISVDDDVFKPKTTTVKKGTTVKFKWVGESPHNVSRTGGPSFSNIGTRRSGSASRKLSKAGTYKLVCTIHPGMNLTIKVK